VSREFHAELLGAPNAFRERFSDKGRALRKFGTTGNWSFQIGSARSDGTVSVWIVGPLEWWTSFHSVPVGSSFDDALFSTGYPDFVGWDRDEADGQT
jgi:hypothetical protein